LTTLYDYLFGVFDDIQSGNYEAAFNGFSRLIDDMPTAAEREMLPDFIYYYRGLAAAHIDRWNDAIVDFGRLLANSERRQSPDSLIYYLPIETNEYRYMLGVLYQRAGKTARLSSTTTGAETTSAHIIMRARRHCGSQSKLARRHQGTARGGGHPDDSACCSIRQDARGPGDGRARKR
jgi:hypothetical protein